MAKKMNLEVVGMYFEERSALKPGRPEFAKMMNDLNTGKADGIICWKLDRLARNMEDGGNIIQMLQIQVVKRIVASTQSFYPQDPVYLIFLEFGVSNQQSTPWLY